MTHRIEFAAEPSAAELQAIANGLREPNPPEPQDPPNDPLAFFVRDGNGGVAAGVVGNTAGAWLYVAALWVAEPLRGHRVGTQLMDAAEELAVRRGCTGAYLDTFSPRALAFYRARGYDVFGELDGGPAGRTRTFLRKPLRPVA